MSLLFVLGASDPEMTAIEALIRAVGCDVLYAAALDRTGALARCHAGNAYTATGALPPTGRPQPLPDGGVWVECGPVPAGAARIDHHNPGDPGYGRPPAEFLSASSLGQVVSLLAREGRLPAAWPRGHLGNENPGDIYYCDGPQWWVFEPFDGTTHLPHWSMDLDGPAPTARAVAVPQDLVLAAAADHCLAAAYVGACQGVDPKALAAWRDASRAAYQRRPVEAVRADRERAEAAILAAPKVALPCPACAGEGWEWAAVPDVTMPRVECGSCHGTRVGAHVRDLRDLGEVPEAPEACARLGEAILYRLPAGHPANRTERAKVGLLGAGEGTLAGTAPVEAFLAAARRGRLLGVSVADAYGDPSRGFAGCYEVKP